MSAKESSSFISVSVCYSLACHAGVKVSILESISLGFSEESYQEKYNFLSIVLHLT